MEFAAVALIYAIYYETRVARAAIVRERCLLPVAKRACNRLIEQRAELRRVRASMKQTKVISALRNAEREDSAMRVEEKRQLSFHTPTRLPRYK